MNPSTRSSGTLPRMLLLPGLLLAAAPVANALVGQDPAEVTDLSTDQEKARSPLLLAFGRLLLPSGEPAEGASVLLEAHDHLGGGRSVEGVTIADGRFAIALPRSELDLYQVSVALPGYGTRQWEIFEPRAPVDLGEVRLRRGGTVVGRIVDPSGKPAGGGTLVVASARIRSAGQRESRFSEEAVADETGRFSFEDLPSGLFSVEAKDGDGRWFCASIFVRPEERQLVELVDTTNVSVPERSSHSTYWDFSMGEFPLLPLISPDWESFEDDAQRRRVEPTPWEKRATIELEVIDEVTGAAVRVPDVQVRYRDPYEVSMGQVAEDGRSIRGLRPGDLELVVEVPDRQLLRVPVEDLQSGETRSVRVETKRGLSLRGVVRSGNDGRPVPGAAVHVRPEAMPGADPLWSRDLTADETGSFELQGASPGLYTLEAVLPARSFMGPPISVKRRVTMEERAGSVELVLPAHGFVTGRVVGIDEELLGLVRMQVSPAGEEPDKATGPGPSLLPDGEYRLGPLETGAYDIVAFVGVYEEGWRILIPQQPVLARALVGPGGETRCNLDLSAAPWRKLTVEVRWNGVPAAGVDAFLEPVEDDPAYPLSDHEVPGYFGVGQVLLDERGIGMIAPVCEHAWRIRLESKNGEWEWHSPIFETWWGEDRTLELDLRVKEHILRVIDPDTAEPWREGVVWTGDVARRLGANGALTVGAPVGASVSIESATGHRRAIRWNEDGPELAEPWLQRRAE